MNWKTWIPFVLALAMGLMAAKVGRDLVARSSHVSGPSIKLSRAVVMNVDADPGHVLSEQDLALADQPAETLPRTAFMNVADLVGRVALQPILKGQVVVEGFLAPVGSAGGVQALVPPGMRAVTVEVNEVSGVGGLLVPAAHVDVVTTFQVDKVGPVTRTIVQNVKILAVGQHMVSTKKDEEALAIAKSVTLIVSPRDAQAVQLAAAGGATRLVLRGSLDQGQSPEEGLTVAKLLGQESVVDTRPVALPPTHPAEVVSEKPPVRVRTVEVINGGQATTVKYQEAPEQTQEITGAPDGKDHAIPGSKDQ
jgi:pilus assembly protein CpaB